MKMVKTCSQIVLSAGPHSISQLASSAHDRDLPKTKEYERTAKRERMVWGERERARTAPILSILRSHCNFSPHPGTRGIPATKDDEDEFGDDVGTPSRLAPSPSGRVSDVYVVDYSPVTKSDVSVASRQALSKRDAFRD